MKPRVEYIYGMTTNEVSAIEFSIDQSTGDLRFVTPMKDLHHKTTYGRPKGDKVVNRIPLTGPDLQWDSDDALLRNFNLLVAWIRIRASCTDVGSR